ncbi:MAG TPA: FKBP-type peptidyl-prolyl cis-trans isomerase [Mucilaginibacter sp.]|nr:FKBP-type peptidyl-prolyl cis-trans isomerase [Mucilaginibacter sp.]
MVKWLLPILFMCVVIAGCTKSNSDLAQYKIQAAKDDKIVQDFITQNNLTSKAQRVSDTSGVYYIVLQPGQGSQLFTNSTQITVGDTGRLLTTQQVFTATNNFHPSYTLQQVILGWQLGIPKIQPGGIVRLLIPSRYAYGPYPQPQLGLPANAILDFNIQLYGVTN